MIDGRADLVRQDPVGFRGRVLAQCVPFGSISSLAKIREGQ